MASAWRVISFFLVVFVLPTVLISLPLYARYHLYHTRHLPITETDTRALNDAVSPFWCQGQRVSSNGTLDAYLVSGTPTVKKEKRHVKLKRKLLLQHDDIEYWGVYLLEGSTFTVSSTARWPGGVLLVAKGEDNLRKCFYREDHLEAELNGVPPKTVYRSPVDVDDLPGVVMVEEEHHPADHGGEVFDDEGEDVPVDNLGVKPHRDREHKEVQDEVKEEEEEEVEVEEEEVEVKKEEEEEEEENDDEVVLVVPRRKGPRLPKRRNGKAKKAKKAKKNKANKNDTLHGRSRRSAPQPPSPPPVLPEVAPSSPAPPVLSDSKLDMLHHFNDTLAVTTGNSSFSSSEEFLEQCRDSILVVELQPSLDWEWRLNTDNIASTNSWHIPVDSSDYYYFIFTSDNSIELNHLGFVLDMHRTTYDVADPLQTCRNASECIFPLAFTQTQSVVVEVPGQEELDELHSFEVTTACQPRVPVYMVFILLVPFIILLFAFQ
ncbi:uncharacterized protein LOC123513639 isoform X3 [Portunus trituberculatus]|nr:uncharacterized protein LOC123513639 isoform X3 [Portunus trituberculatus]XP_045126848.1 uncharacterized protein LOC123513639 isoform X3 [Portunus trituberculatus]XP_045126849.1 uncharacterized protein LOC123513639 isoform X3 [Portunus trituberculatus]